MTKVIRNSAANASLRNVIAMAVCVATLCLSSSADASSPTQQDRKVFEQNLGSRPVVGVIQFYSRPNGNSGYYRIQNTTTQDLKYRVRIILNDGSQITRVVHAQSGRYSGNASFSHAGLRREGIWQVDLLYAIPE